MQVALFVTCLTDQFFAEAGVAAVRLLRHLGCTVHFPQGQTCCGQPAYNAGYWAEARQVADHTLGVLEDAPYVVLPSGSCTTMLRAFYPELYRDRPKMFARALALSQKTYELSEFIVKVLGKTHLGSGLTGKRIAYHHGCHALRELGLKQEPLTLLRNAGAEVVDWAAAEECCGFGGLFSVKLPEVALGMADRKLSTLPNGQVDLLTSGDAGCMLHLMGRMQNQNLNLPVRPLASVLWEAVG
ncbi:(Fe-S)-binding protein [Meiothermus taiwanensis]|jgi:L-lactate dehydrogenase complex protein LldE|uniref:Lactate utilization protein A n=2 Tax=Meiothermus taiwanensis TaxID=172827 RepID=A0A399DS87_9DEIN|nr:(Fe-S)-binding protein [Meiothermus taiwanensis]AWR87445.1 glycolate oxidase [Meiothermus taiwanensis WR-220]KIQ55917.1 Fe-S oxidoreductase [Meiothermus taiwanensis]KZK17112.1 Fe-S oxidoreductase [Meiothermus taiwanensis]RIH74946.1 Lactate utilization protein A [Meiothermus taiwanensis]